MTTSSLTTSPIAPLERLFAQEAEERAQLAERFASIPAAERDRIMKSKTDYLEFYGLMKDVPLAVSRETGTLLYLHARSMRATSIVEFGTSFAISTLHLAAAVRDNGGGRIITCEFEASKVARAQQHLIEGGVADLVEVRAGDALQTLRADLPASIDLVLLDGAKALYLDILALLEPHLRPGAVILADNADMCPEYVARVRSPAAGYLSLPFDEDVEVSLRV